MCPKLGMILPSSDADKHRWEQAGEKHPVAGPAVQAPDTLCRVRSGGSGEGER